MRTFLRSTILWGAGMSCFLAFPTYATLTHRMLPPSFDLPLSLAGAALILLSIVSMFVGWAVGAKA